MDRDEISHVTPAGALPRSFIEVVHDICDQVLGEAQRARETENTAAIESSVNKDAGHADQHNSPPQLRTQ